MARSPAPESVPPAIEAALDAIVSIDSAGLIVQFNAAAEQLFGYSRDEAIGQSLAELVIPPEMQGAHRDGLLRLANGGPPRILGRRIQLEALRKGGERFPVELTVTETESSPSIFTGFVRDITDLVEARAREQHASRILATTEELAQTGSCQIDLESGTSTWSAQMFRIHGLDPARDEASVEALLAVVHPEDRERMTIFMSAMTSPDGYVPEPTGVEYRAVWPDGHVCDVRARCTLVLDEEGKPRYWVGAAQDMTHQRLIERELRAHAAVDVALGHWRSFEEGVGGLLRRLGRALGYPVGSLWARDEERRAIVCRAFWSEADTGDLEELSRRASLPPGVGIPGVTWEAGHPMAFQDLSEDLVASRQDVAESAGLESALAVPIISRDEPLAVLVYYASESRSPGVPLMRTLAGIGEEIGRFLEHRRADLGTQPLSPRELEILELAAEGNTGPEIARQLDLSPATVKTHFENIYEKLGVGDRAAAVAHALRSGILE